MLKKTITYTDWNGNEVSEDFWFNLTQAEIVKLNYSYPGGLEEYTKKCASDGDIDSAFKLLEKIITLSYGKKSLDGKRFIKSTEITDEFMQTEAYSNLFMELITDTNKAQTFVNGIIPKVVPGKSSNQIPMNK